MKKYPVVVIGSGPAGIMAALQAAGKGVQTLLLEKNSCIGNKLLITGGGRCNLTNNRDLPDFIASYHNGDFLRNAFARFCSVANYGDRLPRFGQPREVVRCCPATAVIKPVAHRW